ERNRSRSLLCACPCRHELIYYQRVGRVVDSPSPALLASRLAEEPIPRSHTGDLVAEHVRRLIFSGVLRPGDKVPQDDLAAAVHRHTMEFHRLINRAGASERQRSVLRGLARMLPSGFFPDVPGAERSERNGVERIWKAIHSGDPEMVRTTCLTVQRERGEL